MDPNINFIKKNLINNKNLYILKLYKIFTWKSVMWVSYVVVMMAGSKPMVEHIGVIKNMTWPKGKVGKKIKREIFDKIIIYKILY